jgi:hypothetical protein
MYKLLARIRRASSTGALIVDQDRDVLTDEHRQRRVDLVVA